MAAWVPSHLTSGTGRGLLTALPGFVLGAALQLQQSELIPPWV